MTYVTYVAAVLAAACFGLALRWLGVVAVARRVVATSREAAECIRDPALSDLEKEKMVQGASLSLMRGFLSILARGVGAFGLAALLLLALDAVGAARAADVTHWLATWQGIVVTSVVMLGAYFLKLAQ